MELPFAAGAAIKKKKERERERDTVALSDTKTVNVKRVSGNKIMECNMHKIKSIILPI